MPCSYIRGCHPLVIYFARQACSKRKILAKALCSVLTVFKKIFVKTMCSVCAIFEREILAKIICSVIFFIKFSVRKFDLYFFFLIKFFYKFSQNKRKIYEKPRFYPYRDFSCCFNYRYLGCDCCA